MPNNETTTELTQAATDGAIAADQQQVGPQPILVGPTTGKEFNTIGERLIPKGCFCFEDIRFAFDSSFVLPGVAKDMPGLADLRERHTLTLPGSPEKKIPPPLSIFGHADPVGSEDYNKQLSGRRAKAVYGMLVRDVQLWDDLFTHPLGGDNWGDAAIQTMLNIVSPPPKSQEGLMDAQSQDPVKAFQSGKGLTADGIVGPITRKALFLAYMNALCGSLKLDKENDFLAHHKDPGGKGDYQGCSEFNPVLMFSKKKNADYEQASDKKERNEDNEPNRRVMVLLYAPGRRVNYKVWPCPRVNEGVTACKKRFFLDAAQRRSFQEKRREFAQTKDTFACRFYQLVTDDSPCERRGGARLLIRLIDIDGQPRAGLAYELEFDKTFKISDFTSNDGVIDKVIPDESKLGTLTYDGYSRVLLITTLDDVSTVSGAQPRLVNLAFGDMDAQPGVLDGVTRLMLKRFQNRHNLTISGDLDGPTVDELRKRYGS
ncbi:MAG: peptidoglycan-binding protein [Desulfobulbaceae bacterium]|nr:peptidoglycan-binding protein [Desulfobulbaceae bacterium]